MIYRSPHLARSVPRATPLRTFLIRRAGPALARLQTLVSRACYFLALRLYRIAELAVTVYAVEFARRLAGH